MVSFTFLPTIRSQAFVNLGPYTTYIQDPFAKSQEKRATSVDREILFKLVLITAEVKASEEFVKEYKTSLSSISLSLSAKKLEVRNFLNSCISYIVAKNSIQGNIPGLSKLATKMRLVSAFKTHKIRVLKDEADVLFASDNYMTEGERKVLLLDIIDRALLITI